MADRFFIKQASRGACRARLPQVRAERSSGRVPADLSAGVLQPEFRSRMEYAFDESFSDVVVRSSRAVDTHFGGIAATVDQSILIGSSFFSLAPPWRERVLAHELAHVVQKRRSARASTNSSLNRRYRERLEAEAHLAAVDAIEGGRAACHLPDVPWIPAAWGPAGHYWTCYFVMLAAGVNEEEAQERAFFCQMPDQVREFDASCAGIDWAELDLGIARGSPVTVAGLGQFFPSTDPASVPMYSTTQVTHVRSHFTDWEEYTTTTTNYWQVPQTLKEEMAQREIDIDISDGLHSLTGGHGSAEVKYREQQLKLFKDDPLIFGLALHAYGDSYAHQDMNNSGRMYPPVIGHAIGLLRPREAKETDGSPMRFADNMHEPDDISNPKPGRAALYQTYVGNLYRIFLETLGTEPRIKPDAVLDALKELTDMQFVHQVNKLDDDGKQRKESGIIREALRKSLKIGPAPYAPEEEKEVYWRQFWPQYADIITKAGGDEQVFGQVRKMGHQWRSDLSFSTRNTSEAETEQHDRMEREIEAAPRPSP